MFVTDAPNPASPTEPPHPNAAAPAGAPTRSCRLLGLVRKLIGYGREVAIAFQAIHTEPAHHFRITRSYGTLNINLIVARIARGMRFAFALEAWLVRSAARLDLPPRPAAVKTTPAAPRAKAPRERRAPKPRVDDDEVLLSHLPTDQEIAALVRRRPIGMILADICHDLGILPTDKVWWELTDAVLSNGGTLTRLMGNLIKRTRPANFPDDPPPDPAALRAQAAAVPWAPFAAATGPP